MSENGSESVTWHRVLATSELPEGRVTTVSAGLKSVALVHYDGKFSALDNHCPHQGGPLGEDAIAEALAHDGPAMVEVVTDAELV